MFDVISLFSGGGGLDLGFQSEGYRLIWAIDNNPNAVASYRKNVGDHIICEDINLIDPYALPKADVVIGGPPCQSFSLAGNRNTEDARGQLVWKYMDIIRAVQPQAFVFENVTGLQSARNKDGKILPQLMQAFERIGYKISFQVMNAADYGVPQRRKRVVIVGLKNGASFVFPAPTHSEEGGGLFQLQKYISVSEALGDLPDAATDEDAVLPYLSPPENAYQAMMRSPDGVTDHTIPQMSKLDRYIVKHVKPGGNYMDIPPDVNSERIRRLQRDGGHTTCYGRLAPDQPSYTINTYFNRPNVGCNIHYAYDRLITIREALRLQSFPDSYRLVSSSKQGKHLIVGNAVPPLLGKVIAHQLLQYLEGNAMWIHYHSSEVNVFHPVCDEALRKALVTLGMTRNYEVLHHQYTGPLEMDFVIKNRETGKYLCVIEVKRTPQDVHSARYQYQAMSYVQMNAAVTERPFYILTNLEYAFSFRYDANRPRVFQQMLAPGLHTIGRFSDYDGRRGEFVDLLAGFFAQQLQAFLEDRYTYSVTLEQFAFFMEAIKGEPKRWKSGLAVLLYEYIRGAFSCVARNDLHDVRLFRTMNQSDVLRICQEAAHVNFGEIFDYSEERFLSRIEIDHALLNNLFDFGRQNVNGDSVAGVLHQIVSAGHEHDGEVPTDLELGRVVAVLARHLSGELSETDQICDPAAGSGNLISSAIDVFHVTANQIVANDINPQLGELLSLRLGLNYVQVVSPGMSPAVSHKNIVDLDAAYFRNVKVVLMNPPFLGGVYAVQRKQPFFRRIHQLAGRDTNTNVGQMPLEAAFLELVTYLVAPGTVIACVFPKTHLHARGTEAQTMRRILLNDLGLHTVFTYPGTDLFADVTRDTCVLVGKAKQPAEEIAVIASCETIPNLDLHQFSEALNVPLGDQFAPICAGVVGKKVSREELAFKTGDGWRDINSEMLEAITFVDETFRNAEAFRLIADCEWSMKRGGAGNSGGSDLLFFDSDRALFDAFQQEQLPLKAGMRNAERDTLLANEGDSLFLDVSVVDDEQLNRILDVYLSIPQRDGRQARRQKSKEEWKRILERESRGKFLPNSVLIPRALRRKGRVHLVENDIFVSTNFQVCYGMNERDSVLLATWISTIFYQLICEVSSKDQEGMRKMEIRDIAQTMVPMFESVSEATFERLKAALATTEFVDLQSPEIREVDTIWAEALFREEADSKLEEARRLLAYTANRRNA